MKNKFKVLAAALVLTIAFTSCTNVSKTMREPNARMNFVKSDFTFTDQVTGDATVNKIIGVDWSRLLTKKKAHTEGAYSTLPRTASIPVIGALITDPASQYAMYELMKNNPGYDVVFYPQFETRVFKPVLGIGWFYTKTEVKVIARLGKINK